MKFLISALFYFVASQYITIPILYSKFTPNSVVESFSRSYNCPKINSMKCKNSGVYYVLYEVNSPLDIEILISELDFSFSFDGTFSLSVTSIISDYARSYEFVNLVYGYSPNTTHDFVYYSESSYISLRDTALSFIDSHGWQKVVVILGQEFQSMDFRVNDEIEIALQSIVPSLISYEAIRLIFAHQIKPLGTKVIVIATNQETAVLIQKAIVETDMNKADYAFIFLHHSVWAAYLEGSILIADDEYIPKSEEDYLEYLVDSFSLYLVFFMSSSQIHGSFSSYILNDYMKTAAEINSTSYLYNIQKHSNVLCGSINGNIIEVSSPFIFPGNSITAPDNEKINISISAYGGASNPDGTYYVENALALTGAMYAAYDINDKSDILANFELSIFNISDCGASIFEYDYCYDCLKAHLKDIGYFHLSGLETVIAQGTIQIFRSFNLSIPVLGIQTTASLSDSAYYPQYARVSYSNIITGLIAAIILNSFGIKKVSLLCTNSTWGTDFKTQFEKQCAQYRIEILNENRLVPSGYNGTDTSFIEEIIYLKSRYLVMEVTSPDVLSVIETFYDAGVRKGDLYLFIGDLVIDVANLNKAEIGHEAYKKRKELMDGLLYFGVLTYYGSIGEKLKKDFMSTYGLAPDIMCLYYDATYLGARALGSLISQGINLNSTTIAKAIRWIKFTGCTGKIQINKYGNDRSTIRFGIYNLVQVNSTWTMRLCGIYNPDGAKFYEQVHSISWFYENEGVLPNAIIGEDHECPFRSNQSKSFLYGYLLLTGIGAIPLLMGVFLAVKYSGSIFTRKFPMLEKAQEETLIDIWIYIEMIIESLQYMAIGPDFTGFMSEFSKFTKFAMLDIMGPTKDSDWSIWDQIKLIDIIAAFWIILLIQRVFHIGEKWKISLLTAMDELGKYCLPIIGDLLFIPIVNFLLITFQCTNSIGNEFKDSYHDQDCTVFCWQGMHMKYVIISSIVLLSYLPASLYSRPMWQDETEDLVFHIREQPFHSVMKSFWQILLIVLRVILFPASQISYNACCFTIILLFTLASWFIKRPYNYHRASMWYSICLTDCLWFWTCREISQLNLILAECLLGVGWVFSLAAGIWFQKKYLPSLLIRPKGQDILRLFRFQLSRRTPSEAGIDKSVKYQYVEPIQKEDMKSSDQSCV
ncbi:unnamed protein product [Blepharisma stoltei]|uniref:Receptor ligand binding region domain-containing protein n=1 Tax=Blepharisma stoltei TaxID=1481888 RepID=A0AAU9JPW5_9CILI|nr:unnamed protein product [Blepharisma stoltei]